MNGNLNFGMTNLSLANAGVRVTKCKGFKQTNFGDVLIPQGQTFIVVSHGLAVQPNVILLTAAYTDLGPVSVTWTEVGVTTFKIKLSGVHTADAVITWDASFRTRAL